MTSDTTPAPARTMCKRPGCTEPAAPATGPGRLPEYCEGRGHTRVSAWRERRRLAAAQAGTTSPAATDSPVMMAKVTGAELLRLLRAEADRVADIAGRLARPSTRSPTSPPPRPRSKPSAPPQRRWPHS